MWQYHGYCKIHIILNMYNNLEVLYFLFTFKLYRLPKDYCLYSVFRILFFLLKTEKTIYFDTENTFFFSIKYTQIF